MYGAYSMFYTQVVQVAINAERSRRKSGDFFNWPQKKMKINAFVAA